MAIGTSREFHYKDAHFHIVTDFWDPVINRILDDRHELEDFIKNWKYFQNSLKPVLINNSEDIPESVRRMQVASLATGLGPMASVAGTLAQLAAETSREKGSVNTIIENGGDIYLDCSEDVIIGLYTGMNQHFKNLALEVTSNIQPLAICTSSGRMGHSLSFGDCDIVTVLSSDASLADGAATLGCNSVHCRDDIEPVLNRLINIEGVRGAIIIRDEYFGAVGDVPPLVKSFEPLIKQSVSRDDKSNFK